MSGRDFTKLSLRAGPLSSMSSARDPDQQRTSKNGKRRELVALVRLLARVAARELTCGNADAGQSKKL